MIKSITIKNTLDETDNGLTIELGAPEKSGLWVKSIKGIGPGKADINTTDFASSDGGVWNSSRSQIRNITFTLGILEYTRADGKHISVEEVRHSTYKWFSKKREVTFTVTTDRTELTTYGYIESAEPDIFSKQETMAISIICPDPNWYNSAGANIVNFSGTNDIFEFPVEFIVTSDTEFQPGKDYYEYDDETHEYYLTSDQTMKYWKTYYEEDPTGGYENPIDDNEYFLTSDEEMQAGKEYYEYVVNQETGEYEYVSTPDTEFNQSKDYFEYENNTVLADISQMIVKDIDYKGEVKTGVTIIIRLGDDASGIRVYKFYDEYTNGVIAIDDNAINLVMGTGLKVGDEIRICTVNGRKSAVLIRNAEEKNIINALGKNPDWFQLDNGLNTFTYDAVSGFEDIQLEIDYVKAYEGI